jgi:hypothetical protein
MEVSGELVPFRINDPVEDGVHKAQLPNPPGFVGAGIANVDTYVGVWEGLAKSLVTPPEALPYDKISFLPDPSRGGIVQPPGLAPESIAKIFRENVGPQMILQMRLLDVERYSVPSQRPETPGWRVVMRNGLKHPTKDDLMDMRRCERYLQNCNFETGYADSRERDASGVDSFGQFLRRIVRDTMRFDGIAIWTQMDAAGRVVSFKALPAGNIRLCGRDGYMGVKENFAVLVDDSGSVQSVFTRDELVWYVRNPRNDTGVLGYGYPEAEQAIKIIMGMSNAIDLNVSTFDKNGIPNGILKLKGDGFSDKPLDALARMWLNMKRGISKYWSLPAINVPKDCDIEILDLNDLKGTDIRYKTHINMMEGILCALMGFPVRRLGYHTSGERRDSEPTPDGSTDMVGDDDPGLAPLLTDLESVINPYLVWNRWPHLSLEFNAKTPKSDARRFESAMTSMTWGEKRAINDMVPLSEIEGLDPKLKPLADFMSLCPVDSNLAATYQTIGPIFLEVLYGTGEETGGKDPKTPGARTGEKKDPAISESKGALSGVRRSAVRSKDR